MEEGPTTSTQWNLLDSAIVWCYQKFIQNCFSYILVSSCYAADAVLHFESSGKSVS